MPSPLIRIACLALLAVLCTARPAEAAATHGGDGIEWYGDMHLGDARPAALADWKNLQDRAWQQDGRPVSFAVSAPSGHAGIVDHCGKLAAAARDGLRPQAQDAAIYNAWGLKCAAVRLLSAVTAPKHDYLGHFALDNARVRALPSGLAFSISRDDARKLAAIAGRKGTLGDYLAGATIEVAGAGHGGHAVIVDAQDGTQRLAVLARGDFDRDGIADVLVATSSEVAGGDYRASCLYVISRLSAGGALQIRRKISITAPAD